MTAGGDRARRIDPASLVEYECFENIVTLALNRPEKLSAFSDALVGAPAEALRRFVIDAEVHVATFAGVAVVRAHGTPRR